MIRLYICKKIFDIILNLSNAYTGNRIPCFFLLLRTSLSFFASLLFPLMLIGGARYWAWLHPKPSLPCGHSSRKEVAFLASPFLSDARPWATNHQPWFYYTFATGGSTQPNIFSYLHTNGHFLAFQLRNVCSLLFFRDCLSKTVNLLWQKKLVFGIWSGKAFCRHFSSTPSRPCLSVTALNDRHAHGREKQEQTLFKYLHRWKQD